MKQDLDGFTKLSILGRGAYSTIYLGRDKSTGEICAIKQVKIANAEQMKYIGHLESEHAIAQRFDHPVLRKTHKVIYYRKWLKVQSASLIMEYADGKPLSDMMPSSEYIRMLKIFRQLALGLDAMHWCRYVHADLKPENVIVNTQDRVKLIDYGQSFEMGQAKERIQGTVDFIAPEQVRREILDQRTDVFGLGAIMHRVFTNRPLPTVLNKELNQHTLALVGKRVDKTDAVEEACLPTHLAKLLERCCQAERENRPPNMKAVVRQIELTMIKIHSGSIRSEQQGTSADQDDDHTASQAAS